MNKIWRYGHFLLKNNSIFLKILLINLDKTETVIIKVASHRQIHFTEREDPFIGRQVSLIA